MAKKISYEFNPYTFARISAMKSLLLRKEDYDKLLKLEPNEMIKFLQDGVYREEINSLAIKYSGIRLVERAVINHASKVFSKLKRISDPDTESLMNQYLKRYDIFNLKTILRGKNSGWNDEDILDNLMPFGILNQKKLKEISSHNNPEDIIEDSGIFDLNLFKDSLRKYEETKDLSEIENLMDYHYYTDALDFSKRIPKQGILFKEFFQYEIDAYNLQLVLKKLYFNLLKEQVLPFLVFEGKYLNKQLLESMISKENLQEAVKLLSKTKYSWLVEEIKKEMPLLRIEVLLEEFLLRRAILLYHQHPLTVDVTLGFMFAKEIEIKNLIAIIKSKKLDFQEEFVKRLIVV